MAVHFAPPRQAIRMRTAFFAFVYPPWEMGGKGEDDALAPDVEGASLSRASRNITAVGGDLGAAAGGDGATSSLRDGGDAAPLHPDAAYDAADAQGTGDASCPSACTGGTCVGGACRVTCSPTAPGGCVCPPGVPCTVVAAGGTGATVNCAT